MPKIQNALNKIDLAVLPKEIITHVKKTEIQFKPLCINVINSSKIQQNIAPQL